MTVSRENAVWPYIAWLFQAPALKVVLFKRNGIPVPDGLARYLAKNDVIAFKGCNDQGGAAFGLGQIGEGKWYNNDIALYKPCQASSSWGMSQSFLKDDSLAMAASSFSRSIFDLRKWTKSSTSSRYGFGHAVLPYNSFI